MPRLLLTSSTLPRWPTDPEARFVLDLARHLPSGWEPLILAPAAPGSSVREVMDGIPVLRYRYAPLPRWETLCYPGSTLARVQQHPLLLGLVPGLLVGLRRAVAAELRAGRYDCVHAHWFFPQGLVHALAFSPHRHPPLVVTSHGGDLGLARRWPVLRPLFGAVLRRIDAVTVVAPGIRDLLALCDHHFDVERVPVIPMGADLACFRPDLRDTDWPRRHGLKAPVILFVGRLVEKKGLAILIDAFSRLPLAEMTATLAICGDGPLADDLRQRAERLGVAERVRFLGALDHRDLAVAYASSDIFCTPSVAAANGDLDGMPTVLAEAAASGLPLVGSQLAGIPLIVEPDRTGLLVPSGDAAALAQALHRLIADAALRRRLAAGALTKARDFSWPRIAAAFAEVYAEASDRHHRRLAA